MLMSAEHGHERSRVLSHALEPCNECHWPIKRVKAAAAAAPAITATSRRRRRRRQGGSGPLSTLTTTCASGAAATAAAKPSHTGGDGGDGELVSSRPKVNGFGSELESAHAGGPAAECHRGGGGRRCLAGWSRRRTKTAAGIPFQDVTQLKPDERVAGLRCVTGRLADRRVSVPARWRPLRLAEIDSSSLPPVGRPSGCNRWRRHHHEGMRN
jgi:hypothetical protein